MTGSNSTLPNESSGNANPVDDIANDGVYQFLQTVPWRTLLLIFLGALCLVAVQAVIKFNLSSFDLMVYFFPGILLGMSILVALIGGLMARHWLLGSVLGFGIFAICLFIYLHHPGDYKFSTPEYIWVEGMGAPLFFLISTLPFLSMRLFFGWRISQAEPIFHSIRIEDYLIAIAVLGSFIALFQAGVVIAESRSTNVGLALSWYVLGMLGLVVNLIFIPVIWYFMRSEWSVTRLIMTLGILLSLTAMVTLPMSVLSEWTRNPFDDISQFLFWCFLGLCVVVVCLTYLFIGLELLKWDGYRLYTGRHLSFSKTAYNKKLVSSDPSSDRSKRSGESKTNKLTQAKNYSAHSTERGVDPFVDQPIYDVVPTMSVEEISDKRVYFLVRCLAVGMIILAILANIIAALLKPYS